MRIRALVVVCMSAASTVALLACNVGCSRNEPGGGTGVAPADQKPFWANFKRPAYSDIPLEEVEAPLLQEIKAAAPELERAMLKFELEPAEDRNAIPAGDDALTAAKVNAEYLDYRLLELESYRAGTKDTGEARAAGEAFLLAYLRAATGQRDAKSQDEIRQLGEAAIARGSRDPLVRAYLARIWMSFREWQRAHDALVAVADEFDAGSYPANVSMLVRQWVATTAQRLKEGDIAILARIYAAIDAAVRFLEAEATQPNQRFVRRQYAQTFSEFGDDQQEDFVVACLKSEAIPRWQQHLILGDHLRNAAWKARGTGFVNTINPADWQKFSELLGRAAQHYMRAWQLRPEYPEAAAMLVSVSLEGADDGWTPRNWFLQAVRAQSDYTPAYENYLRAWQPRWGGSHEEMLAFARECLATNRWDTEIPFFAFSAMRQIRLELGQEASLGRIPDILTTALALQKGMLECRAAGKDCWGDDPGNWAFLSTVLAQGGHHEEARAVFEAVGPTLAQGGFDELTAKLTYVRGQVYAMTGPARDQARAFEEALGRSPTADFEPAVFDDLEQKLAQTREIDSRPEVLPYYDDVAALTKALRAFHAGEWAELPFDANLSGWVVRAGTSELTADGTLRLSDEAGTYRGPRVTPLAHFPPPYAVEAEIGRIPGRADRLTIGILYGNVEPNAIYAQQQLCAVTTGEVEGWVHVYFPPRADFYSTKGWQVGAHDFHQLSLRIRPGQIEYRADGRMLAQEKADGLGESTLVSFGGYDGDERANSFRIRNVRFHKLDSEGGLGPATASPDSTASE